MRSVLITDDVHDVILEGFQKADYQVDYRPAMLPIEVLNVIHSYDGLIINSKVGVNQELIDKAIKLKFVGRLGSGLDHVDLEACKKAGVRVLRSPEGNANAVGEHCLAMLLALLNKIHLTTHQLKQNSWLREQNRGRELDGLCVGVVGLGHTGKAFVRKLQGFDVRLLVYDKYVPLRKEEGGSDLAAICKQADIISFHVPLTPDTHQIVNSSFIEECIKKPIIINSSRGSIINTVDVLNALKGNRLSGLCIDVFEDEPISKNEKNAPEIYQELMHLDQVISSPHIAGWSHNSKYLLSKILLDKILRTNE